jgi:hypothetical protein
MIDISSASNALLLSNFEYHHQAAAYSSMKRGTGPVNKLPQLTFIEVFFWACVFDFLAFRVLTGENSIFQLITVFFYS